VQYRARPERLQSPDKSISRRPQQSDRLHIAAVPDPAAKAPPRILAAVSFPILTIFVFKHDEPLFIAFGIAAAILVILTHQKNIVRLINGEENKAKLFKQQVE